MKVDNTKDTYGLSRKAASELLKVSIRTLDRYIKSQKLSTRMIGGRIWLSKDEVDRSKGGGSSQEQVDDIDMSISDLSTDLGVDKVDDFELIDQGNVHTLSSTPRKTARKSGVYKKLFEELKDEIHEKQERLEIANYRVGQLETQLRNSIPMLEYHRESYKKKQQEEESVLRLNESVSTIKHLKHKLKLANFNKRLFVTVLLIILALQPLWLLIQFDDFFR